MGYSKEELYALAEEAKEKAIELAFKTPGVRIDRQEYLEATFAAVVEPEVVSKVLATSPVEAGISQKVLNRLANEAIKYETYKVSLLSVGCGLGGWLGIAPDLAQYYVHCFRLIQKLGYLYGYPEMISEDSISDAEKTQILIFMGIMFGVKGANEAAIKFTATFATKLAKDISKAALTKTSWYPILKEVLQQVGVKMTKKALQGFVSKYAPIVGGGISGVITYKGYSTGAKRMHKFFQENPRRQFCSEDE